MTRPSVRPGRCVECPTPNVQAYSAVVAYGYEGRTPNAEVAFEIGH